VYDSAAGINTNFGSATQLLVKNRGTGFNRESDLRFDLTTLSTINTAKLRLFGRLQSLEQPSVTFGVYGSSNLSWGESTVTWNNRPAATTGLLASASVVGTTAAWYENRPDELPQGPEGRRRDGGDAGAEGYGGERPDHPIRQ